MKDNIVYTHTILDQFKVSASKGFLQWQKENPNFEIVSVIKLDHSGSYFIAYRKK